MYSLEANCITERISPIFDHDGREYYLEVEYIYYENFKTIYLYLIRCKRESEVARANCILESRGEMLIADIVINNNMEFASLNDKIFRLTHWNEPVDYRRKGLGTYLLQYIIDLAKTKGVNKIYGSLTEQDINENPNLINWYKKHGFKIEPPTSEEIGTAKHRICLYLKD
ncbi:GNAT family N-acetyltransferase [Limnoraphis robusta Tam1]|uniref:GNAT family N-acetyltransferase n=1 Tax=Limnoraphis robusta TaxID=1118279 RepID=UPI002B1EB3CA|nr:GNAT family N-acetyltransferase [Limnoraphis robusta]MEA5499433.1 GNAT family N-acetyltransferase [Limnoraphis robusta BA-68 BA1]MEA5541822.1 GNAT family N-acetyltransferase [Limnoraphis robusta Tam1]